MQNVAAGIKIARAASSLPFALLAIALMAATFGGFLQTDDYCTFGRVIGRHGTNPFAELAAVYENWTGRYSSSFLMAVAGSLGAVLPIPLLYPFLLILIMLLFGLACVGMSRLASASGLPNPPLALVMFCSTLLLMPSKLEQYLWLTGAAVYFVGASLQLILTQRLARQALPGARGSEWSTLLLVVAITGFNEFLALVAGTCLAWAALRDLTGPDRPHWKIHAIRMVVFLAALAVTILAPGNFARDATSSLARHEVFGATSMMFQSLGGFGKALATESSWLFAASLLAAFCAGMAMPRGSARPARAWLPYALILVGAFPMHLWVYSFLTGEPTPGRVINQALTLAQVMLCLLLAWAGARAVTNRQVATSPWRALAGLALAGVLMASSPSSQTFLTSLSTFAPTWRAQQIERHEGLSSVQTRDPVYLRPFATGDSSPPTFAGSDITADPSNWINRCVADYYGVDSVILMRRSY